VRAGPRHSGYAGIRSCSISKVTRLADSAYRSAKQEEAPTSKLEIEEAFRDVLSRIEEDSERNGYATHLAESVLFRNIFAGYRQNLEKLLLESCEETDAYDEMISLCGIPFASHCEHHVAPIIGRAWVAYLPDSRVVGMSKLARVFEA
jgi:GTP cyclohydrolase IA